MAIVRERESHPVQGYYYRYRMEADDVLYVHFIGGKGMPPLKWMPFQGQSYFVDGVPWHITPDEGATVEVAYAFRDDYDKEVASHWVDHGTKAEITEVTGYTEDSQIGALRFTASDAGALFECYSPMALRIG